MLTIILSFLAALTLLILVIFSANFLFVKITAIISLIIIILIIGIVFHLGTNAIGG